jgi:hypothetical protein
MAPAGAAGVPGSEVKHKSSVVGNTYLISHDLFLRAMGLVYFAAIFSNYVQWPGLAGYDGACDCTIRRSHDNLLHHPPPRLVVPLLLLLEPPRPPPPRPPLFVRWFVVTPGAPTSGLEPAHALLASERRADLSSWENFLHNKPTLAWFAPDLGLDTDTFFEALCLSSLVVAAASALGLGSAPGFAFLWLSWFSQQRASQTFLSFQWDVLLLEAGALTVLWAPVLPRPLARRVAAPLPPAHTVMWGLRFLVFKLMFVSGIVKLQAVCPTWLGLTALDYHYATQCVATPLAWYAHQVGSVGAIDFAAVFSSGFLRVLWVRCIFCTFV